MNQKQVVVKFSKMNPNYKNTDAFKGYTVSNPSLQIPNETFWKKQKIAGQLEYGTEIDRIPFHGEPISSPLYMPPPLIVIPETSKRAKLETGEKFGGIGYFTSSQVLYQRSKLDFLEQAIQTVAEPKRSEIRELINEALTNPDASQLVSGTFPNQGVHFSLSDIDLTDSGTFNGSVGGNSNTIIIVRGNFTANNFSTGNGSKTIIIAVENIDLPDLTPSLSNDLFLFCGGTITTNISPGNESKTFMFSSSNSPATEIKPVFNGQTVRRTVFDIFATDNFMTQNVNQVSNWFSLMTNPPLDSTVDLVKNQIASQYQLSYIDVVSIGNGLYYIKWTFGLINGITSLVFTQNTVPNFGIHTEPFNIQYFAGDVDRLMMQTFRNDMEDFKPIGVFGTPSGFYMTLHSQFHISISESQYTIPGTTTFSALRMLSPSHTIDDYYRKKESRTQLSNEVFFGSPYKGLVNYHPMGCLIDDENFYGTNGAIALKPDITKSSQIISFSDIVSPTSQTGKTIQRQLNAFNQQNGTIVYADSEKVLIKHGSLIKKATLAQQAIFPGGVHYSFLVINDQYWISYFINNVEQIVPASPGVLPFPVQITFQPTTPSPVSFDLFVIFPDFITSAYEARELTTELHNYYQRNFLTVIPFYAPTSENNRVLPTVNKIDPYFRTMEERLLLEEAGFVLNMGSFTRFFTSPEPRLRFNSTDDYVFVIVGKIIVDYPHGDTHAKVLQIPDGTYDTIVVENSMINIQSFPILYNNRYFVLNQLPVVPEFDFEISVSNAANATSYIKSLNFIPVFDNISNSNYTCEFMVENGKLIFDNIIINNPSIETRIIFKGEGKTYLLTV